MIMLQRLHEKNVNMVFDNYEYRLVPNDSSIDNQLADLKKEFMKYRKEKGFEDFDEDEFDYYLRCNGLRRFFTYDQYRNEIDGETYHQHYTSKSGDEIVVFEYYNFE